MIKYECPSCGEEVEKLYKVITSLYGEEHLCKECSDAAQDEELHYKQIQFDLEKAKKPRLNNET